MRHAAIFAVSVFLFASSLPAQNFPERPASALALFHNDEREVAAASDGTDFLVVAFRAGVLAHRVTAAGEVLDEAGIRIPFADDALRNIKILGVFWAGDAYTIVSQSLITTGEIQAPSIPPDYRAYVTRIDRDGRIIDGPRVVYASRFLLWSAVSNGSRIVLLGERLTILDVRGNLLESNLPIPSDFTNNFDFQAAWNGKGFMVTWSANRPFGEQVLRVAPLDADGRPTGASTSIPAGLALQPAIASDGNDYVVVYKETTAGVPTTGADFALHIGPGGEVLEKRPLSGTLRTQRSIVWNGTNYVVAVVAVNAKQLPSIFRLDRTGAAVDPNPVAISAVGTMAYESTMVTATDGRRIFVAWQESAPAGGFRSFGAILGSDATPGPPFALGLTPGVQLTPQIAAGRDNFMVVWEESSVVYASRMTFAGELLDGRGIELSKKTGKRPRVVFDGQTYVVAWISGNSVVAANIRPDGTIVQADEKPIVGSCSDGFGLATDGVTALVAASDCQSRRVHVARVYRDGTADAPVLVSPNVADTAAVSWNGERYLVVWRQVVPVTPILISVPAYRGNILAARLSPSLAVLDATPLSIAVSNDEDAVAPLVASNGADFLVAWTTGTTRARIAKSDGTLGETIAIAPGSGTSLVWDGRRYALAFSNAKDVFVTHVGAGSPAAIAASPDVESDGALAPLGNGVLIAAYVRQATEHVYGGVPRVFVKGIVPQSRTRAIR